MSRSKKSTYDRVKKITIRAHPKKTVFVVKYGDGRRVETPYVEIIGASTLYIDPTTKEATIRTENNVNLGRNNTCAVCGEDADDSHAHA